MPGFSLTVLLLPDGQAGAPKASEILSLLDDVPDAPGWKWTSRSTPGQPTQQATASRTQAVAAAGTTKLKAEDVKAFIEAVKRACNALIKEEPEITRMDNIAGDGDCGLTLRDGAQCE